MIAIVVFGLLVAGRDRETARGLLTAGGVFTVSLACRMADTPVCDSFPLGTHFIWHMLNATVLYLLLRVVMRRGSEGARLAPA